jgi:hypothetical protein
LGYKTLNGSSLKVLSSLLKYGLLEKTDGDQRRVTDLAVRILHPTDEADKRGAILEAASRPALFKEIANAWENGPPSDENLKSWLIRRQFAADAVSDVIKAYRDTMDLVAREGGAYDSAVSAPSAAQPPKMPSSSQATPALQMPGAGGDPFYFTFKPSIGFEGGFRLNSLKDFEHLIYALNGFKKLYTKIEDISPGDPIEEEDDEPSFGN